MTGNSSSQVDNRTIAFIGPTGRDRDFAKDIRGRQFRPTPLHHNNRSRTTSGDREVIPIKVVVHPKKGHQPFRRRFVRVSNSTASYSYAFVRPIFFTIIAKEGVTFVGNVGTNRKFRHFTDSNNFSAFFHFFTSSSYSFLTCRIIRSHRYRCGR